MRYAIAGAHFAQLSTNPGHSSGPRGRSKTVPSVACEAVNERVLLSASHRAPVRSAVGFDARSRPVQTFCFTSA